VSTTRRPATQNTSGFPVQAGNDKRDINWVAERTTEPN